MTPSDLSSERAWRSLEDQLRPFVARRVPPGDVDDVMQEVFIRIQRGLATLQDEERFGAWVYRLARNAAVDHARVRARHPLLASESDAHEAPEQVAISDEDDRAAERDVARYTAFFVTLLPSPYREALTLTELEGLTQREAAEMLGVSLSGMKSRVQRGRQKLRAALEDCCNIALDARRRVVACTPRPNNNTPEGCCE